MGKYLSDRNKKKSNKADNEHGEARMVHITGHKHNHMLLPCTEVQRLLHMLNVSDPFVLYNRLLRSVKHMSLALKYIDRPLYRREGHCFLVLVVKLLGRTLITSKLE